ncbi:hypothetical protein BDF20DRAFT_806329, partial [Mycotypha africana]|uniref:uncharacterized protein n=1 Tax=Mycotypha africana TaxID=64632 RepID=UPI0023000FA3
VKRERIDSFRFEVWEEWKTATSIKQRLIYYTNTQQSLDKEIKTVYTTTSCLDATTSSSSL